MGAPKIYTRGIYVFIYLGSTLLLTTSDDEITKKKEKEKRFIFENFVIFKYI
jgi:hypothetical protein